MRSSSNLDLVTNGLVNAQAPNVGCESETIANLLIFTCQTTRVPLNTNSIEYDMYPAGSLQALSHRILEGQRQINDLLMHRGEEDERRSAEHKELLAAIASMQVPRPVIVDENPRKRTGRKVDVVSEMKNIPRKPEFQVQPFDATELVETDVR